jgi:hypothetical protein
MRAHSIRPLLAASLAALALLAFARPASAFSRPVLDFAAGTTIGADSRPNDGGASGTLAATWPVLDWGRFGVQLFADDMGTKLDHLKDVNDGSDLGIVADRHRWTWGGAWCAERDVWKLKRWTFSGEAALGWWRTEDDLRGTTVAAVSSIGSALGMDVRRDSPGVNQLGFAFRFKKIYKGEHPGYDRVGHYGTAALTWRWRALPRP